MFRVPVRQTGESSRASCAQEKLDDAPLPRCVEAPELPARRPSRVPPLPVERGAVVGAPETITGRIDDPALVSADGGDARVPAAPLVTQKHGAGRPQTDLHHAAGPFELRKTRDRNVHDGQRLRLEGSDGCGATHEEAPEPTGCAAGEDCREASRRPPEELPSLKSRSRSRRRSHHRRNAPFQARCGCRCSPA